MTMAGFLFQPHRVLLHLATSPRGSVVGLETLDDIAVQFPDGLSLLEQTKLSASGTPLGDTSRNLWRSLQNWKHAIERGDVELDHAVFHLVTNTILPEGMVRDLRDADASPASRRPLVAKLRETGVRTPATAAAIAADVLTWSDDQLLAFISRITVIDGTESGAPAAAQQLVFERLAVPVRHQTEIYEGLLGWIDQTALRLALEQKPIWFTREAFENQYRTLLFRYEDVTRIRETAERLMLVTENERQARFGRLFVSQLEWTGLASDDEQILEAIDAHVRSGTETTRLSREGNVSPDDFKDFDQRLITRWKILARKYHPTAADDGADDEIDKRAGQTLLNETMLHREMLAGQETTEYYLTQGAYHRLADDPPAVGCHPRYKAKVQLWRRRSSSDEAGD
jgi:hypothetical protein